MKEIGSPVDNVGSDPWDFGEFADVTDEDLLARMLYSEARGESPEAKRACLWVYRHRVAINKQEFGGNTLRGVLLRRSQFEGMTTESARRPDASSPAWQECLALAQARDTLVVPDPVPTALWFLTNAQYRRGAHDVDTPKETFAFGGSTPRKVTYKRVIGGQTFFRVEGY